MPTLPLSIYAFAVLAVLGPWTLYQIRRGS